MTRVATVVHRHTTALHHHLIRLDGYEWLFVARQSVVQVESHKQFVSTVEQR